MNETSRGLFPFRRRRRTARRTRTRTLHSSSFHFLGQLPQQPRGLRRELLRDLHSDQNVLVSSFGGVVLRRRRPRRMRRRELGEAVPFHPQPVPRLRPRPQRQLPGPFQRRRHGHTASQSSVPEVDVGAHLYVLGPAGTRPPPSEDGRGLDLDLDEQVAPRRALWCVGR